MAAFQRLIERRPDLDLRLNVVGLVAPDVAVAASQLAKRSKGRIVLHGLLADDRSRPSAGLRLGHRLRLARGRLWAAGRREPVARQALPVLERRIDRRDRRRRRLPCPSIRAVSTRSRRGFERLATDPALYDAAFAADRGAQAAKLGAIRRSDRRPAHRLFGRPPRSADHPRRLPRSAADEDGAFVSRVLTLSAAISVFRALRPS